MLELLPGPPVLRSWSGSVCRSDPIAPGAAQRAPSAPAPLHLLEPAEKSRCAGSTRVRLLTPLIVTPVRGVARLTQCAHFGHGWSCSDPRALFAPFLNWNRVTRPRASKLLARDSKNELKTHAPPKGGKAYINNSRPH